MHENLTVCPDSGNGSEDGFRVAQKLVSVEYNRISTSRRGRSQPSLLNPIMRPTADAPISSRHHRFQPDVLPNALQEQLAPKLHIRCDVRHPM
jgi:hypothetical protein